MARRVIVFGVDGLIQPLAEHLAATGHMPNLARLLREGAVSPLLPFVSTWGPINWLCFAAGTAPGSAWQGQRAVRGEEASPDDIAETLWQAVARQGGASVVVSFPGNWPPSPGRVVTLIPDLSSLDMPPLDMARPARWMTAGLARRYRQPPGTRAGWIPLSSRGRSPRAEPLLDALGEPCGWRNLPPDGQHLCTTLPIRGPRGTLLQEWGLLCSMRGHDAGSVKLCRDRDASQILAKLQVGVWSPWLVVDGLTAGDMQGFVRVKLLESNVQSGEMALCHSQVYPSRAWAHPAGWADDLLANVGPYSSDSAAQLRPTDPHWRTAIQEAQHEADWLVGSARYMAGRVDWRLWTTVFRPVDAANHGCLAFLDAAQGDGATDSARAMEILTCAYGVADRMLGALVDLADRDTVVALASDHGAAVNRVTCDVYNLLVQHGLLALSEEGGRPVVDWEHTQAYIRPNRSASEVFVNLRGREPHGIVEREEFEAVQRRIIDLLLDWRESETGTRAVALALRSKDAPLLGYWGQQAGDVQFIYNEGFVWGELEAGQTIARATTLAVNHGPQVPTAGGGLATNMGMLALWGPGVRRGYRRPSDAIGPARMCDPAATIAFLLGLQPPRHSQGAILHDMLDPQG